MTADELPELAGDRTPEELLKALEGPRGRQILVGHEPLLGNTIGRLVSGAAPFRIELKKSGVCAVRVQEPPTDESATLLWLLTSKQLRMIGKS
jgi:phosphohistidine phosphatase SixA